MKKNFLFYSFLFLVISTSSHSKIRQVCIGSGCVNGNFIDFNFWFGGGQQNDGGDEGDGQQNNDGGDGQQNDGGDGQQNDGQQNGW